MTGKEIVDNLVAEVERATTVEKSAVVLINGFQDRMKVAVDAAIAGGVTLEQLAPIQAELDGLKAGTDELVAAVSANTPAANS